jgi:ArsR family transcriptional regulator, arsenate/arsenite/antimonite-responsive transcriptional repressor
MLLSEAAQRLAELGNVTRLSIFRLLIKAGPNGLPVGEIQRVLNVPGSTLSHHIRRLMNVGLVVQKRESRTLYCSAMMPALRDLLDYLVSECCSGNIDLQELS